MFSVLAVRRSEPFDRFRCAGAVFIVLEDLPASDWLGSVRDAARIWHEEARALRHWAGQAINEPDDQRAWAAAINMARVYDGRCSYLYRADGFKIDPYSWRADWLDLLARTRRALRDRRLKALEKSKTSPREPTGSCTSGAREGFANVGQEPTWLVHVQSCLNIAGLLTKVSKIH